MITNVHSVHFFNLLKLFSSLQPPAALAQEESPCNFCVLLYAYCSVFLFSSYRNSLAEAFGSSFAPRGTLAILPYPFFRKGTEGKCIGIGENWKGKCIATGDDG